MRVHYTKSNLAADRAFWCDLLFLPYDISILNYSFQFLFSVSHKGTLRVHLEQTWNDRLWLVMISHSWVNSWINLKKKIESRLNDGALSTLCAPYIIVAFLSLNGGICHRQTLSVLPYLGQLLCSIPSLPLLSTLFSLTLLQCSTWPTPWPLTLGIPIQRFPCYAPHTSQKKSSSSWVFSPGWA